MQAAEALGVDVSHHAGRRLAHPVHHEVARLVAGHHGGDAVGELVAGRVRVHHEVVAAGSAASEEAAGPHGGAAALAAAVEPGHHEVAGRVEGGGGIGLHPAGGGVDLELAAQPRRRGVEALGEDLEVRAPLAQVGDHEAAVRAHGHAGRALDAGGVGVHQEGGAHRRPARAVALSVHGLAVVVGRVVAGPGHHEVAVRVGGHVAEVLGAGEVGIDLELGAQAPAPGVEALAGHAVAGPVLVPPRDDEVAAAVDGQPGPDLRAGPGADRDHAAQAGPGGVEALGHDLRAGAGGLRPGHDEVALAAHGHRRVVGVVRAAHGELAPPAHPRAVVALALDQVAAVLRPGDHEVAAGSAGHARVELRPHQRGVHDELAARAHLRRGRTGSEQDGRRHGGSQAWPRHGPSP